MGRSRLVNSFRQICGSYWHRPCSSWKQVNVGWCGGNSSTVSPCNKSIPLAQPSARRGFAAKSIPVRENTSRAHSSEESWPRRLQRSMIGASNKLSHNPLDFSHSPSRVGREAFYCEQRCGMSSGAKDYGDKETISVTFVDKDGEETEIRVPVGMSLLEAAHENDIELEGACEGSLACSTCHLIVMDEEMYSKLPEPTDEENDMLDLAFGLTETSRLGCQVIAQKELDGLRVALPAATRNFAVDGHVPKPH